MILWLYDTSRSELVYADPQAGPIRFPLIDVAVFMRNEAGIDVRQLEVDLRKSLPRADRSQLIVPGMRLR